MEEDVEVIAIAGVMLRVVSRPAVASGASMALGAMRCVSERRAMSHRPRREPWDHEGGAGAGLADLENLCCRAPTRPSGSRAIGTDAWLRVVLVTEAVHRESESLLRP